MKTIATLVGCAIGDALGNPFEMKAAASPSLVQWDGFFKAGGTFWVGQAGQYTDDTLMSIALAASLIENEGFNPDKVATEYLKWYETGNTRGIGSTTASAMLNLQIGATWEESGLTSDQCAGNGSAMRISPIGLYYRNDLIKLVECAVLDASITHNSMEPKMGSMAIGLAIALLANESHSPLEALNDIIDNLPDCAVQGKLLQAQEYLVSGLDAEEALARIGVSGYVPETVGAAFYCLAKNNNFKDTVIMAIKCGGDTDTTAAIAGALAGTHYGLEGIPNEYRMVEDYSLLQDLTESLLIE